MFLHLLDPCTHFFSSYLGILTIRGKLPSICWAIAPLWTAKQRWGRPAGCSASTTGYWSPIHLDASLLYWITVANVIMIANWWRDTAKTAAFVLSKSRWVHDIGNPAKMIPPPRWQPTMSSANRDWRPYVAFPFSCVLCPLLKWNTWEKYLW